MRNAVFVEIRLQALGAWTDSELTPERCREMLYLIISLYSIPYFLLCSKSLLF
jgi:hypothetical protein